MNANEIIGCNIKNYRIKKNISIDIIAKELNKDMSYIERIENGKITLRINEIEKIANILNIDIKLLFSKK